MHKVSGAAVGQNRTEHTRKHTRWNFVKQIYAAYDITTRSCTFKTAPAIQTFSYVVNALKFWLGRSGFIISTDSIRKYGSRSVL
jgi:hypothetical protein